MEAKQESELKGRLLRAFRSGKDDSDVFADMPSLEEP
jgi:hypothetical protein